MEEERSSDGYYHEGWMKLLFPEVISGVSEY